jgi:uncharacterized protein
MDKLELKKILQDQIVDFTSSKDILVRHLDLETHVRSPAVSVVLGVRRCGKSTLLRQIAMNLQTSQAFYISLDDPRLVDFKAKDFETVYEIWLENRNPSKKDIVLFFDEVQEVNGWEKWINYFSETKRHKVFVTGSNSKLLSSELSTYLTGRHLDLYLTPLSFRELAQGKLGTKEVTSDSEGLARAEQLFENYSQYGGFPRPFLDQSLGYLANYYSDIVQKDIIVRGKIRNKNAMLDLSKIVASETTRLVNHTKIARLLKLKDEATIRNYCRYIVQTYLYYELRCFSKSIRVQNRSLPKYYCIDHAMAQVNGFWKIQDPTRVLELIVCSELKRSEGKVFYWKSKKNLEVDFLIALGNTPDTAIQVCYSMEDVLTEEREVRALDAAYEELHVKKLVIITRYERRIISRKGYQIRVIPILDFLFGNGF